MYLKLFLIVSISLLSFMSHANNSYGKYSGSVKAEWLEDGRKMKLLESFSYTDPNKMNWEAPKGSVVDGASIPPLAWSIIGSPFSGKYRSASVIHDIACQEKNRTWEVVHLSFYYGMLASDVNIIKAKIMYAAVYHFGPRWPVSLKIANPVFSNKSTERFKCSSINGKKVCSSNPQHDPRPEVLVQIPPEDKNVSAESFKRLVTEIERGEKGSSPLSLEQIVNWGNVQ